MKLETLRFGYLPALAAVSLLCSCDGDSSADSTPAESSPAALDMPTGTPSEEEVADVDPEGFINYGTPTETDAVSATGLPTTVVLTD